MNAPSQKIVVGVFLPLVVVVLGALWYLGGQTKTNKPTTSTATSTLSNLTSVVQTALKIKQAPFAELISTSTKTQTYGAFDIHLGEDSKQTTLHTYGLAVAYALKPYSQKTDNEARLVLNALDGQGKNAVAKITTAYDQNQTVVTNLLAIPVPPKAGAKHLALLNAVANMSPLLKNMSKVLTEPIVALQSAEQYPVAQINFYKAVDDLNRFLIDQGVKYTPSETININVTTE